MAREGNADAQPPPIGQDQDHYFSASPATRSVERQVGFAVAGRHIVLVSSSGVFSADHLDNGTRTLIDAAPIPEPGSTVLDLGTGFGPIACALALQQPTVTMWAVDTNERAVDLTARNAAALGLPGVHACRPDEVPDDLSFDAIYSNPPIRVGKTALHGILIRWLGRLRAGGHAYLVVHKHLGSDSLQRWLVELGYPTSRMTSVRGFRVLDVANSRR